MATLSGLITQSSAAGLVFHGNGVCKMLNYSNGALVVRQKKKFGFLSSGISHFEIKCESVAGRSNQNVNFGYDELNEDPYWVVLTKKAIWAMKSLAKFLFEQPTQIKYIEWPSFWSTLKTATLTLVLVGLLIIALASVDSALSYVLALLLRKAA